MRPGAEQVGSRFTLHMDRWRRLRFAAENLGMDRLLEVAVVLDIKPEQKFILVVAAQVELDPYNALDRGESIREISLADPLAFFKGQILMRAARRRVAFDQ